MPEAPPPTAAPEKGWEAIDQIPVADCLVSQFAHVDDVPHQHTEGWAHAMADVLEYWKEANDEAAKTRGLKWLMSLHDILLRMPPRGGRRGRSVIAQRFAAWQDGDLAKLVKWWAKDREAAHLPMANRNGSDSAAVERAVHLISEGELSKAVKTLESDGLGNLCDPRVAAQLQANHPARKEALPDSLADYDAFRRVTVDLAPTLRELTRHAGTGVSGFRNEYLSALSQNFADVRARSVIPLLNSFADAYANAELPAWFYYAFTTVKLVAPIKKAAASEDEAPDVRPIGIGECLRRAIHSCVIAQCKEALGEHLWPQQVGVGVPGGISKLVFGARLQLEARPDWVVVKIDLKNAHNEIKRSAVMARLNESPQLRCLAPLFWASCAPSPEVFLAANGTQPGGFESAEGMHQGDPLASAAFCAAIHPEVVAMDTRLNSVGGAARFDMDDGYAIGPAEAVFGAILAFAGAVGNLGLELQLQQCTCFSPAGGLDAHPDRPGQVLVGSMPGQDGMAGFGIDCCGVPIGDPVYIEAFLAEKANDVMSNIRNISLQLRARHLHSMHALTYYCLQHKFQYWTQHCFPRDVATAAARIDGAVRALVAATVGEEVNTDELASRRLQLPARMFGGGIRSMVDVAPAAFLGGLCRSVPSFIQRAGEAGGGTAGFMPNLTEMLGRGAFDAEATGPAFAGLVASGLPTAQAMQAAWTTLASEIGTENDGPLMSSAEYMRPDGTKLQNALTKRRELIRFQSLDIDLRSLANDDMRKAAWLNTDRFSTAWVSSWPTPDLTLSNPEFLEVATFYFGLPSPGCASAVGERIANTRAVVDAYGTRLTTTALPGDGWRSQHDALKWRIAQDAREMQVRMRTEVFGLFAGCMPQAGRRRVQAEPVRKRQGLVPDFLANVAVDGPERQLLFELKTLHYGVSTYSGASNGRCAAVARRAAALPGEYAQKAARADQAYCGTAAGDVGPVARRLQGFEHVRGLVFGAWGEASPMVEALLSALARSGADKHWRGMRCASPAEAVGAMAWYLRRGWALTALRENARLKLDRLEHAGRGAVAAADRRAAAHAAHTARGRLMAAQATRGARTWRSRLR